nr:hypothetical protein [uncultured Allomuricauda sp.]
MELIDNKEITIAVLPFQLIGEIGDLNPIIYGFTEDLIINFSKFVGLSVISQYSTQNITDPSDDAVVSLLGTDYIITGSFRSKSNQYRIGIQLIRTRDNKVVFAGNHDESLESILNTQDVITQQIVSVLQQQIDHDLLTYSYKKESVELAAYENWLLGMNLLKKGTVESDFAARKHFEAALEIDSHFARAYTGISLTYFNEWSCQLWDRWDVSQKGAHEYALKAIDLDENDYVSLAVLGRTFLYLGDYHKSEHYFRKSFRMNPNDADNLVLIAFYLVYLGYAEEAEQLYLKAKKLNPLHPDAYFPQASFIYFELGDYEKSILFGEKVSNPSIWTDFPAFLAAAYYHLSEFDKMQDYFTQYLSLFQKNINNGIEPSVKKAIDWQKIVNPYKTKTNLEPFWEFITTEKVTVVANNPSKPKSDSRGSFAINGEFWELNYLGQSAILKDSKGLHDIAKLLGQPEKQFHCSELMGTVLDSDGSPVVDNQALNDYKKRIRTLQSEISEAEEMNDFIKADELREEYEDLMDHLSKVTGMAGKTRKVGSSLEKARSAVTWRIRNSIKKVENVHPQLAKHLSNTIKTGTFCCYTPDTVHEWII